MPPISLGQVISKHCCADSDAQRVIPAHREMPIGVTLIDRIVVAVCIARHADAGQVGIPPVRRNKPSQHRIIVAGVEEDVAGFRVMTLADIALGFLVRAGDPGFVTVGAERRAFDLAAGAVGNHLDRFQVITVMIKHLRANADARVKLNEVVPLPVRPSPPFWVLQKCKEVFGSCTDLVKLYAANVNSKGCNLPFCQFRLVWSTLRPNDCSEIVFICIGQ